MMNRKSKYFILILISFSALLYSFSRKNKKPVLTKLKQKIQLNYSIPDSLFHSGDIIFRDGRGFISNVFRKLSLNDPQYSHAGIVHKEKEKYFVYHVIGGEENKNNTIKKDLLNDFCSPIQSNSWAVYRTDLSAIIIDSIAGNYYSNKLIFDYKFDLSTDDKMYCTELIYKILNEVSGSNNFLSLTTLSGTRFVACDNIYLSPHINKIYSKVYTF